MGLFFIGIILLLGLGLRLQGALYSILGGLIGIAMVIQLLLDGGQVTYVTGAGSTSVSAGEYFLLVPILLSIVCFIQSIQVVRAG